VTTQPGVSARAQCRARIQWEQDGLTSCWIRCRASARARRQARIQWGQGAQADDAQAGEQPYEDPTQGSEPEASPAIPTHDEISVRAYFIYLETPESDDLGNWLRAERELMPA